MIIQGQVGAPAGTNAPGATPAIRQGQLGDLIASELHGRYYETTYRKNGFTGVATTGLTTSAGLATSFTGLMLYNPPNSTINVVINKVGMSFIVAFTAAAAVGLMTAQTMTPLGTFSASNTAIKPNFVGGGVGQAVMYSSATIASAAPGLPGIQTIFGSGLTGAITTVPAVPGFFVDLEGSLILPPGAYAATYTSTASGTNSMLASFSWEEVPV